MSKEINVKMNVVFTQSNQLGNITSSENISTSFVDGISDVKASIGDINTILEEVL